MNRTRIFRILLLGTLLSHSGGLPAIADEDGSPEKQLRAFMAAVGEADTAAMADFYAAEVTVFQGATLLDKKYGALGGEDGRDKDRTVTKEDLLKAYERAFEAFGGKDDWVRRWRSRRLKDQEIKLMVVSREHSEEDKLKELGVKAGDAVAIVHPTGDSRTFVLRKNDMGKWLIIGEHWD